MKRAVLVAYLNNLLVWTNISGDLSHPLAKVHIVFLIQHYYCFLNAFTLQKGSSVAPKISSGAFSSIFLHKCD